MPEKKKYHVVLLLLLVAGVLLAWGYFVEPQRIRVKRVIIHDTEMACQWGDLKIVQISDLHITSPGKRENMLLEKLSEIHPDIIVVTGDMAQWNRRPEGAINFIEKLHAPSGVYCIMGDADFSSRRYHCLFCHPGGNVHLLRKKPVLLRDRVVKIRLDDSHKIYIAGVAPGDDWGGQSGFPQNLLAKQGPPVLVLSHFSGDWAETDSARPMLWLSGDTHGGQIWLPDFVWRMVKLKPDPVHMSGLFRDGKHKWLYVNSGIGMTENVPVRIGVPPEITVFSFEGEEKRK